MLTLVVIVGLQVAFMCNFELSANRLNRDLEQSQRRVHTLQERLAAVEHSALACYGKLNATELRVLHESRIINEETRELRNLTSREHEEGLELRNLRQTVSELNMTLIKSKITLRYEMELWLVKSGHTPSGSNDHSAPRLLPASQRHCLKRKSAPDAPVARNLHSF